MFSKAFSDVFFGVLLIMAPASARLVIPNAREESVDSGKIPHPHRGQIFGKRTPR